jgi:hypothetical protein
MGRYKTYLGYKLEEQWPEDADEDTISRLMEAYRRYEATFEATPNDIPVDVLAWCVEAFEMEGVTPNQRVAYLMVQISQSCPQYLQFLPSVTERIGLGFDCYVEEIKEEAPPAHHAAIFGEHFFFLLQDIPALVRRFDSNWRAIGDELTQWVTKIIKRHFEIPKNPSIMAEIIKKIMEEKEKEAAAAPARIVVPSNLR